MVEFATEKDLNDFLASWNGKVLACPGRAAQLAPPDLVAYVVHSWSNTRALLLGLTEK